METINKSVETGSVDQAHRLITSDLKEKSLEERVQAAQVVILLENHYEVGLHPLNGRLIESHWDSKDILLTEGNPMELSKQLVGQCLAVENKDIYEERMGYLPPHILEKSASWDTRGEAVKEEIEIEVRAALLISFASNIYPYLYLISKKHPFESLKEMEELIVYLDPDKGKETFISMEKMSHEERFQTLLGLVQKALEEIKTVKERLIENLFADMSKRNASLANKIHEFAQKHRKVWVIAGEAHGQYHSLREMDAVSGLYQSLEANKLTYATLKVFKGEASLPFEYEHSREAAILFHENALREEALYCSSARETLNKAYSTKDSIDSQYLLLSDFFNFEDPDTSEALFYCELILEKVSGWKFK